MVKKKGPTYLGGYVASLLSDVSEKFADLQALPTYSSIRLAAPVRYKRFWTIVDLLIATGSNSWGDVVHEEGGWPPDLNPQMPLIPGQSEDVHLLQLISMTTVPPLPDVRLHYAACVRASRTSPFHQHD